MRDKPQKPQTTPDQPAPQPADQPAYVPPPTQEKRQRSVVRYIAVLFAAAFLLLLMTSLMDQRQNEVMVDSINASMSDLRDSLSNVNSAQEVYEENLALVQELEQLRAKYGRLEEENQALDRQLDQQEKAAQAMDWFWQVDEAYVLGRYTLCRNLIAELDAAGLAAYLPQESVTDNGRFSPAGRLEEIRTALA